MEPQHGPRVLALALHGIGVDEEGERGPVGAGRRLDDIGKIVLLGLLVEIGEAFAAEWSSAA